MKIKSSLLCFVLLMSIECFGQVAPIVDKSCNPQVTDCGPTTVVSSTFIPKLHFDRAVLYGGAAFDLGTTLEGLTLGRTESNPFLKSSSKVEMSVLVMGSVVAADFATRYLKSHGHEKIGQILNYYVGGLHLTAGFLNLRKPL